MKQINKLKSKNKESGFTIIEVMIVLVIAAVIILIVFLAVPALQRNSRNNQRKNDASRLLAAANEYRTNNSNAMPTTATQVTDLAGTLGIYTTAQTILVDGNTLGTDLNITAPGGYILAANVHVVTNSDCESSGTVIGRAGRNISAFYFVETGGGVLGRCI